MARLLCLKAAWMMDQGDARAAAPWISQIKVVAPRVALKVTDEAVQMFGAQGITQDTPLARTWTHLRTLAWRTGRTPCTAARSPATELKKYTQEKVLSGRMKAIVARDFATARQARICRLAGAGSDGRHGGDRGRGDRRQFSRRAAGAGPLPDEAADAFRARHGGGGHESSAVGPEVKSIKVGDRVAAMSTLGGYAEKVGAPERRRMKLPDGSADGRRLRAALRLRHLAPCAEAARRS